ncbi:MAG TPA: ATP-binding protein [Ramlibacter sp.]|nr:ATP-binding protein [Ramlibacter sp.]
MTDRSAPHASAAAHVPQRVSRNFLLVFMIAAALAIAAVVWLTLVASQRQQRERESARIEAIADLRASQVSGWLREKIGQARFAGNSPLGEMYARWRDTGDTSIRDRLMDRLASFLRASGGAGVLIMNDQGQVVASDPPGAPPQAPEPLRAAAERAIALGTAQITDFYGQEGPAPAPRLDVVAPLVLSGLPARGVVVLRIDPRDYLFPLLNRWPLPSQTASAQLVRREGDALVGPIGRIRMPVSTPNLLAAIVVRGEAPQGKALEALDFRGEEVLGVVRQVEGAPWLLTARMARHEIYADSARQGRWIIAAGVLSWLTLGALAYLLRERHALRRSREAQARQEANRQRLEELVESRTRELAAKNQALERTVSDLEAFSASVSHDLRGPLRTVNGFATLLERSEGERLSDEGRRKLGRIQAGALAMDRMIEDILACSRAERVEMHFASVDLDALVRELVHELVSAYPSTRVSVGPLPVVRADPTMAWQVFANLVGNALKFSARQPHPHVEIGMRDSPAGPWLYVQDNGIGFDNARADQLFAPFERLHGDDFPGSGVGLSIVKRLIERHGGGIEASSEPGRTVFRFSFAPASQPVPVPSVAEPERSAG